GGAGRRERLPGVGGQAVSGDGGGEAPGGVGEDAQQHVGDAGGGCDGGGWGGVAGHGRAVDQGVFVGVGQGPVPHGAADRRPAVGEVVAGHGCLLGLG